MVLVKLGDELEIPDMLPQLVDGGGGVPPRSPQGFAKVKKAITMRKRLSFTYTNTAGTQSAAHGRAFGLLLSERLLLRCRL